MSVVAEVVMLAGAALCAIAALGTVRFQDTYSRMHAATKVPTLGIVLVLIGASVELRSWTAASMLTVIGLFQLFTAPVSGHLLGRSVHDRDGRSGHHDELNDREDFARPPRSDEG